MLPESFGGRIIYLLQQYGPSFAKGAGVSMWLALVGALFGCIIGFLVGIVQTIPVDKNDSTAKKVLIKIVKFILACYVEFFRGTPMMAQAMFIYFGSAYLFNINMSMWFAAIFIVSINTGAYMAETVRGVILSIDTGQTEGAKAIGMTHVQTMINVILPQALRNIKPQIGSIPLAELRGQRVLLPSLRQDLFSPLWAACARAGFAPNAEIGPSFYQAYYLVQEQLCTCLTRYEPGARRELDRVRDVLLEDLPPLCVSLVQRRDHSSAYIDLLRSYLLEVLGSTASLPPRRGRPAKPFNTAPVLSSAAAKAAPEHPVPGTQLPFAGGNNFRELGGYRADEGKTVKWGQIYRGFPTGRLPTEADRARLDGLGLRLILDLRSGAEAAKLPDYVPDGARLVQICGLRDAAGQEIDFSPNDIQRLVQSAPAGMSLTQLMYRQMLTGNKAFKELFRALEAGETPILFHCTSGKDRTGVAAMLILLALGASDEPNCADYARTNLCRAAEIEKAMADHAAEIAADPAQRMRWQSSAGVDPETAPFVLRTIRQDYGSAESYLEAEYGLTPARLMRLRRMYLE